MPLTFQVPEPQHITTPHLASIVRVMNPMFVEGLREPVRKRYFVEQAKLHSQPIGAIRRHHKASVQRPLPTVQYVRSLSKRARRTFLISEARIRHMSVTELKLQIGV